jgi:hypothetical protein
VDIAPFQAELNTAAQKLCVLFDSLGFQNKFKVFSAGFYVPQEAYKGYGYPDAFDKLKARAALASDYYLLIGRESNSDGVFGRFWVDLKLPETGVFECIDQLSPSLRSDLTAKYGIIANLIHEANGKAFYRYNEVEIKTMDSLLTYITSLKECCIPSGQQRRGPSCSSCAFSQSEFASHLINKDFAETKCIIQSEADSSQSNNNAINRIIRVGGEEINVDLEIQKYIDAYKASDSSRSVSVYTFAYPDVCSELNTMLDIVEDDTSCLVIVAGIVGVIGEDGSIFLKTFYKNDCIIKPNGPGNIYVYDMHGIYKFSFWGNHYHGIYFTDSPFYVGRIDFKNNETKGDAIAKFSSFFISDNNISYLIEMQKKSTKNKHEYGGLVSLGASGEMVFEECTWCSATAEALTGSLDISKYLGYKNKSFVSHWHTHPEADDDESQTPSGLMRALNFHDYSGDFFLFKNQTFIWQGSELGASASAENTWQLPGRIGIIAGELGITIYRFVGDYFEEVGPRQGGYVICSYHPTGYCYLNKGTIDILDMTYIWIKYNLSEKKP